MLFYEGRFLMSNNFECMFKANMLFPADTPNPARAGFHTQLPSQLEISHNTCNIKLHATKQRQYASMHGKVPICGTEILN